MRTSTKVEKVRKYKKMAILMMVMTMRTKVERVKKYENMAMLMMMMTMRTGKVWSSQS